MATRLDRRPSPGMSLSDESPLISVGATTTELCALFGVERRDIRTKLAGLPPTGRRDGLPTWKVWEAAPRLVPFDDKDAASIARVLATHPHQLPKLLAKEFWAGQKNRIAVLSMVGALWDTKAVVELAGSAFKTIRLSLMLVVDTLDRETNLTPQQRELVTDGIASLLEDLRIKLVAEMEELRTRSKGKGFLRGFEEMFNGFSDEAEDETETLRDGDFGGL